MTIRTTYRTLSFAHAFQLKDMDAPSPAGRYIVETDEERLQDLSYPAYRRVATRLLLPTGARGSITGETIEVDPLELDAAQARDAARSAPPAVDS
ncbi:MAG: hypothetical protein AB7O88_09810 [Reyranellaceae bacterium]